ncbi:uncharacterized protein LOC116730529 isoform X4 [Xiphophorus hellerii]|uniref:uncharacterized protein LOC116730529 isoform X4 n=1 Tax=Xiphophorus hellerii TaxID=8084 RepID=UPI0013B37DF6|nr:uncharacterized protein LOC116730529 isoform X4 [Xiphophorus hellerii]
MAHALATALTRELVGNTSSPSTSSCPNIGNNSGPLASNSSTRVNQALKRQFPNLFQKSDLKKGKQRIIASTRSTKISNIGIYVLPGPTNLTPKSSDELPLAHAGLGRRVLSFFDDSRHEEIVSQLEDEFIKLKQLKGRWMFHKASGGGGQRKLSIIPMDAEGYNGKLLRSASNNGKIVLFLVPLQEELETSPLPFDAEEFAKMPQVPCVTCGITVPLQMLALHAGSCRKNKKNRTDQTEPIEVDEDDCDTLEEPEDTIEDLEEREYCPICQKDFLKSVLPYHASECCDSREGVLEIHPDMPGPSSTTSGTSYSAEPRSTEEWKTVGDPQKAVELFVRQLKQVGVNQRTLVLTLDAMDTDEERDMSLISFYKHKREIIQWAAPFHCRIQGDAAVGRGVTRHIISSAISKLKQGFKMNFGNAAVTAMFEGETDHLVPTTSAVLAESELFVMAGRLIGHSLINGGPTLSGISLAVVHALTSGSKELATTYLSLEDCPDIDHREIIGFVTAERRDD